jgi:hypothetical protein
MTDSQKATIDVRSAFKDATEKHRVLFALDGSIRRRAAALASIKRRKWLASVKAITSAEIQSDIEFLNVARLLLDSLPVLDTPESAAEKAKAAVATMHVIRKAQGREGTP